MPFTEAVPAAPIIAIFAEKLSDDFASTVTLPVEFTLPVELIPSAFLPSMPALTVFK